MIGILGKPFLDLEPYIDTNELILMHEDIAFGLAMAEPPRTETGSYRWKDESRVDVWTKIKEIRANGNSKHIQAIDKLFEEGHGFYHKAYLYTQLIVGGYTGSRTLLLKFNTGGYYDKNYEKNSIWTEEVKYFPNLIKYISALPFSEIGQIAIYMTENDCVVPIHCDIPKQTKEEMSEFMWFSPQKNKKFFILDDKTNQRHYCSSSVIMFNELDYHGVEAAPYLSYSIHVDGKFTKQFKSKIGLKC